MDDEPLTMPSRAAVERSAPFPVLAVLAPIGAGVVLFLITGSVYSLMFAAFGPLIALAAVGDRAWSERRRERAESVRLGVAFADLETAISQRHAIERRAAWQSAPSLETQLRMPHRSLSFHVTIGSGAVPSALRVSGATASSPDERTRRDRRRRARVDDIGATQTRLRERSRVLTDAPVTVDASGGVCVIGPVVPARALLRAIVMQLVLRGVRTQPVDDSGLWDWVADGNDDLVGTTVWVADGFASPRGGSTGSVGGAIVLACVGPGEPVPEGCATRILLEGSSAQLIASPVGVGPAVPGIVASGVMRSVTNAHRVDRWFAVSHVQAARVVGDRRRADERDAPPETPPPDPRVGAPGALAVALGMGGRSAAVVDLVDDGPHAVVAGMTGSGKSEMLVAWVTRLCAAYDSATVAFLLADFKGGAAFDALADLPHVTGIITDLDPAGAARAIDSLRAEVRRRERRLAEVGARDIADPRVDEPRLVIVVDEFAALRSEHAELTSVFADVAARGRALGMHLVLGTQRATGTYRDELLANIPLRIALRVSDPQDSRLLIGTEAAAQLPGGSRGVGRALIRRAADHEPWSARIVRVGVAEAAALRRATHGARRPRPPFLPQLPAVIAEHDLAPWRPVDGALIGLVDDPARQRRLAWAFDFAQHRALLVLGGPGSGRSTALAALAVESEARGVRVSCLSAFDLEQAWDVIVDGRGDGDGDSLVVVDDVDAIVAALPDEHSAMFVSKLDERLRECGPRAGRVTAIAVSIVRLSGAIARLQDRFPCRLVLPYANRADAVAAGVLPARFDPMAPPGRARAFGAEFGHDGLVMQVRGDRSARVLEASRASASDAAERLPQWRAEASVTLVLARRPRELAASVQRHHPELCVIVVDDDSSFDIHRPGEPAMLIGSAEAWQRNWSSLARLRDSAPALIDQSAAAEYRALWGERSLLPFLEPQPGAFWHIDECGRVERVVLTSSASRPAPSPNDAIDAQTTVGRIAPTT